MEVNNISSKIRFYKTSNEIDSLRDAVECAVTDDEIIFLDHLSGDSIIIQDQIVIDKDLTISGLGNSAIHKEFPGSLIGQNLLEILKE